jgi:hypothetical protein
MVGQRDYYAGYLVAVSGDSAGGAVPKSNGATSALADRPRPAGATSAA